MNIGKKWDMDEENKLLNELRNKDSIEKIANVHGRTNKAIEMRIIYIIQKLKKNMTIRQIAEQLNLEEERIELYLENKDKSNNIMKRLEEIENKIDKIEKMIYKIYKNHKSSFNNQG